MRGFCVAWMIAGRVPCPRTMSRDRSSFVGRCSAIDRSQDICFASSAIAVQLGTRSTACPTDDRYRSASAPPGPPAVDRAAGYFTKRPAQEWLREVLGQARAGTLPGLVRTGVTFAEAAEEYLSWLEVDRERKPSTLRD